ncbi:PAS/PAC sensor hybrid histidine kinase (fragment) [Syntrophobacter sp. SbD1]
MADKASSRVPVSRTDGIRVVLLYGIFASLWILLSGRLVELLFHEPNRIILAGMLMGGLFVAVTCLLLHRAMRGNLMDIFGISRRTTELMRAEEARRESAEINSAIIDQAKEGIVLVDCETLRFVDFNDAACNSLGYSREEFAGLSLFDIQGGLTLDEFTQRVRDIVKAEYSNFENQQRRKDGTICDVLVSNQVICVRDRKYLVVLWLDITERKNAQNALHESELRLRTILQTVNGGFWLIDNDTGTLDLNPGMSAILGRNREDVLGRKIFDFVDDENMAIFEHQIRLRAWGEIGAYEIALSRPDGSKVLCQFNSTPLWDGSGTKVGSFAMVNDISERKRAENALRQSEARYRELFAAVSDAIVVFDADTLRFIDMNESALRCYGYTREEFLNLKKADILADPEISRKSEEGTAAGQELRAPLRYHRKKDGTVFPVEISSVRFLWRERALVCGVIRDITERKRAEREKEKLEVELNQARKMEAIGLLAGGIAHDFNNMLAAIMGFTELSLLKLKGDNPVRGNLEQILKAASRASEVVKQILTFTRQGVLERKPVRIAPIVQDALKLLRSSLPSTIEIRQEVALSPGEDVVLADPGQIHQVLMNFGTNAGHAMISKGGTMSVKLSVITDASQVSVNPGLKAGPHVCITVSDTGHGMDSAVLDRVFDPYFTTKGPGEGTGLGLSVVQGIVKSHNGAITVRSEPRQGTTFSVFLPGIEKADVEVCEAFHIPPAGSERILLVDDEEALVDLGKEILETLGYQVTAMTSSLDALEIFRVQPYAFDLVITDMTMPSLTGRELAKKIIALRSDTPIILSTGFCDLVNEKQSKEAGILEFIMKPYEIRTLACAIRKALEQR